MRSRRYALTIPIEIRDLTHEDLASVAEFAAPTHVVAVERALARAARGDVSYLAAAVGGTSVVGTAVIDFSAGDDPDAGVIAQLAVHPALRRLGIGSLLIRAAEEVIAERGRATAHLAVDDANLDARRLYERLGYRPVRQQVGEWVERWPDGRVQRRRSPQTLLAREVSVATGGCPPKGR